MITIETYEQLPPSLLEFPPVTSPAQAATFLYLYNRDCVGYDEQTVAQSLLHEENLRQAIQLMVGFGERLATSLLQAAYQVADLAGSNEKAIERFWPSLESVMWSTEHKIELRCRDAAAAAAASEPPPTTTKRRRRLIRPHEQ